MLFVDLLASGSCPNYNIGLLIAQRRKAEVGSDDLGGKPLLRRQVGWLYIERLKYLRTGTNV